MAILNSAKNLAKIGLNKSKQASSVVASTSKKAAVATVNKTQLKKPLINSVDKEGNIKSNLGNLYTGKKVNPLYVGAAAAAYLGGRNIYNSIESQTVKPLKLATMNNYQELGAPDVMMYDGVGQERAPRNLNANGSLVFGLHNSRKG